MNLQLCILKTLVRLQNITEQNKNRTKQNLKKGGSIICFISVSFGSFQSISVHFGSFQSISVHFIHFGISWDLYRAYTGWGDVLQAWCRPRPRKSSTSRSKTGHARSIIVKTGVQNKSNNLHQSQEPQTSDFNLLHRDLGTDGKYKNNIIMESPVLFWSCGILPDMIINWLGLSAWRELVCASIEIQALGV